MEQILRLIFVGALVLLILLPLWDGAAFSLAMNARGSNVLSQIDLSLGSRDDVIRRLQEVRSEIRSQVRKRCFSAQDRDVERREAMRMHPQGRYPVLPAKSEGDSLWRFLKCADGYPAGNF